MFFGNQQSVTTFKACSWLNVCTHTHTHTHTHARARAPQLFCYQAILNGCLNPQNGLSSTIPAKGGVRGIGSTLRDNQRLDRNSAGHTNSQVIPMTKEKQLISQSVSQWLTFCAFGASAASANPSTLDTPSVLKRVAKASTVFGDHAWNQGAEYSGMIDTQ